MELLLKKLEKLEGLELRVKELESDLECARDERDDYRLAMSSIKHYVELIWSHVSKFEEE